MADVFVSYARPDEPQAKRVAEALRRQGFTVWRDDELPAHRAYADVIQERLSASKAVVVLWSSEATKSQWVRAEADVARQAGTLIQATLNGAVPPLPFNQIQCADLTGWHGDDDAPSWRKLIDSVGQVSGASAAAERAVQPRRRSVCVLPFVNMSGDAEQEYFSNGISEDITTDLSKMSALSVTARNTAFTFKGQAADVCDIARRLGVSHVLEGSVRKAGGRVRISAQLIDGVTGDHLWAERFDRELTDIFAIQDEISHAIVDALKLRLLPEEKKAIETRGTSSPEAYDLYLMARQYWASGNDGDARRDQIIIRLCRSAIAVDPNYARAWALLALTQAWMRFRDEKVEDAGLEAAEMALELDPRLPEPYCVKAGHFARQGQFEQANKEIAKALKLDPDSWEANREAGIITIRQRRLKEALRLLEKAASLMETDYRSPSLMMSCGFGLNDEGVARRAAQMTVERAERALEHDPANAAALSYGAGGLAYLAQTDRAAEWIRRAALIDPDNIVMKYNLACSAVGIDEFEMALEFLRPFMAKANPYQVQLAENDPDLDKLRVDQRFQEMLTAAKKRLRLQSTVPTIPPAAAEPPRS